jgi:uncharacterized protein YndB with AHSA1/START domain
MPHYSLTLERDISAPAERVYDAWLTPALVREFLKPKPWVTVADVAIAPIVGGHFRVLMHGSGREEMHRGTYQVLDRPRHVSFTWSSEPAGPDTLVTVALLAAGPDNTRVSLRHERLETLSARDNHREGWRHILENLATALEKHAGPR